MRMEGASAFDMSSRMASFYFDAESEDEEEAETREARGRAASRGREERERAEEKEREGESSQIRRVSSTSMPTAFDLFGDSPYASPTPAGHPRPAPPTAYMQHPAASHTSEAQPAAYPFPSPSVSHTRVHEEEVGERSMGLRAVANMRPSAPPPPAAYALQ
uniref:Uncharacterized protein n=1 Tax=Palpitomonas bilix TaxID=652834 RepID=A0A7S3D253_9EUKA|mmetsp:Transcript_19053/g.48733  ORF Transcript_19053/g.48733 Transcript_19053/m.48733 type:complete len:161 (+) Transcript_19053:134-616(+)